MKREEEEEEGDAEEDSSGGTGPGMSGGEAPGSLETKRMELQPSPEMTITRTEIWRGKVEKGAVVEVGDVEGSVLDLDSGDAVVSAEDSVEDSEALPEVPELSVEVPAEKEVTEEGIEGPVPGEEDSEEEGEDSEEATREEKARLRRRSSLRGLSALPLLHRIFGSPRMLEMSSVSVFHIAE